MARSLGHASRVCPLVDGRLVNVMFGFASFHRCPPIISLTNTMIQLCDAELKRSIIRRRKQAQIWPVQPPVVHPGFEQIVTFLLAARDHQGSPGLGLCFNSLNRTQEFGGVERFDHITRDRI